MSDSVDPKSGNDNDSFIVFSLDDEEIDDLGKVIGTKYSREFLKITQKEELNLKEIAKKIAHNENPRLPNPTHHKKRLEKLGLIISNQKLQRKNGHTLNFYKGKKIIIIVPQELVMMIQNNVELQNLFNHLFKI